MKKFYKLQATGNDFIFYFEKGPQKSKEEVQFLCDRHFGIGSDGLVQLFAIDESKNQFAWVFYNPDGSITEMCGNAARCAGRLLSQLKNIKTGTVKTLIGEFSFTEKENNQILVSFAVPAVKTQKVDGAFPAAFKCVHLTNTGVPHAVILVDNLQEILEDAKSLRTYIFAPSFPPEGANLTFMETPVGATVKAVTLERGVNDFTLSCGTGVAAVGRVGREHYGLLSAVEVLTPGGKILVNWSKEMEQVSLLGPAQLLFEGEHA